MDNGLVGLSRPWVADIGCGDSPFPLANILVDKYPGETEHRLGPLRTDGKLFIVADICALPFADRSLDFVWCSSVLEHLDDPEAGFLELKRVGKAGLVAVPTVYAEGYAHYVDPEHYNGHSHLWYIQRGHPENRVMSMKCDTRESKDLAGFLRACGLGAGQVRFGYETEVRVAWGWGADREAQDGQIRAEEP